MRKLSTCLVLTTVATAVVILMAGVAPAASDAPAAKTGFATNVNRAGAKMAATLTGAVNPERQATRYRFQYGPTTSYGSATALRTLPAGAADVQVLVPLAGLSAARAYHFRLVASNASGTRAGADETFKPLTTSEASAVGQNSAILNGAVDALGQPTSYYFQFGTTTAYGSSTSARATSSNGTTGVYADVGGLQPGIVYHYRIVAHSLDSYYYGVDRAFKTSVPAQSQIAVMGRLGFVSPGRWIGVELGCFNGQTACAGHITMSNNGTVVGERNFTIAAQSGGFQNIRLSPAGAQLLRGNSPHHLLAVDVTVVASGGQTISYVMKLARWVWR